MSTSLPPSSKSLWIDELVARYPELEGEHRAETVIVGGGIAGLTTGVLLARGGVAVTVLEAGTIGRGTSGHTSAKISALQGLTLSKLDRQHGRKVTAAYAEAQRAAAAWMSGRVAERDVQCDFERRAAWTYANEATSVSDIEQEAAVASSLGLDVDVRMPTELPFEVAAAVTMADQAQFDPQPYLLDMAAELASTPGCAVHENSRVEQLGDKAVRTARGHIEADHVVVTTLLPVTDRGLFFARAEPKRSYLLAVAVDGPLPTGMYLSADEPKRSLRTAHDPERDDGGELLLVGGGGHVTGREAHTLGQYEELAVWSGQHFDVTEVRRRWSAQDYTAADMLPFAGRAWGPLGGPWIATGFAKWGMTNGTAAAMVISDGILGRKDGPSAEWVQAFDPVRLNRSSVQHGAKLNAEVAVRLFDGWLRPDQDPGEGRPRVRRRRGRPVAEVDGSPGSGGQVSRVCSHLGGIVCWNDAEHTWDCPLHGSRFTEAGAVVDGPAIAALNRSPAPDVDTES